MHLLAKQQQKLAEAKQMLHSTSKTVIEIDFNELSEFVKECYDLEERWFCDGMDNDTYLLFDINSVPEDIPYLNRFAGYDMDWTLALINSEGDLDSHIGAVLARLCYDKFIPPGNYLVHVSW